MRILTMQLALAEVFAAQCYYLLLHKRSVVIKFKYLGMQ